jgi:hypothetical protein
MFTKKMVYEIMIQNRPLHEGGAGRNILRESAAEIVQNNHLVTHFVQVLRDVGAHKSCPSCH